MELANIAIYQGLVNQEKDVKERNDFNGISGLCLVRHEVNQAARENEKIRREARRHFGGGVVRSGKRILFLQVT